MIRVCDDALRQEVLSREDLVATLVNRGILKARLGHLSEAIMDYDAALSRDPDEAEAYLNKGFALLHLPEAEKQAKTMLDEALARKNRRHELVIRPERSPTKAGEAGPPITVSPGEPDQPQWREPKVEMDRLG